MLAQLNSDNPFISPYHIKKVFRKKRSTAHIIELIRNNEYPFDYTLHPGINLIFRDYFLRYHSLTIIANTYNVKSATTIANVIRKNGGTLRPRGFSKKTTFTQEQINFIHTHCFALKPLAIGFMIVRFNQQFNTRKTLANFEFQLKRMGLHDYYNNG